MWAELLQILSSTTQAKQLWCMGLIASQYAGSWRIEPVSPALAGEFFATEPPGKPPIPFVIELVDRASAGAQPEFLLGPHVGFSDCHAIVSYLNSSV